MPITVFKSSKATRGRLEEHASVKGVCHPAAERGQAAPRPGYEEQLAKSFDTVTRQCQTPQADGIGDKHEPITKSLSPVLLVGQTEKH